MLKSQTFRKNILLSIIPVLICIIVFYSFYYFVIDKYLVDEIEHRVENAVEQSKHNIEVILNELDSLQLTFDTNADYMITLKNTLTYGIKTYDEYWKYRLIEDMINSYGNAWTYIKSIYIYLGETGKVLVDGRGIETIESFEDKVSIEDLKSIPPDISSYIVSRQVKATSNYKEDVITLYRRVKFLVPTSKDSFIILNISRSYIEGILNELTNYPEQQLLVVGKEGQIIANNKYVTTKEFDLKQFDTEEYLISTQKSERYNLHYISIVPQIILNSVPHKLSLVALIVSVSLFVIAVVLSYYFAKINYKKLHEIIQVLDEEQTHKLKNKLATEYDYITYGIIKGVVDKKRLENELIDKEYKL